MRGLSRSAAEDDLALPPAITTQFEIRLVYSVPLITSALDIFRSLIFWIAEHCGSSGWRDPAPCRIPPPVAPMLASRRSNGPNPGDA
jgi:hypothetical protein